MISLDAYAIKALSTNIFRYFSLKLVVKLGKFTWEFSCLTTSIALLPTIIFPSFLSSCPLWRSLTQKRLAGRNATFLYLDILTKNYSGVRCFKTLWATTKKHTCKFKSCQYESKRLQLCCFTGYSKWKLEKSTLHTTYKKGFWHPSVYKVTIAHVSGKTINAYLSWVITVLLHIYIKAT